MHQTLPKSIILRGYQSFSRVISNGTSMHSTLLTGYCTAKKDEHPKAIVGFTVSKKRVPLAVHRNRIKRLMREAVRKSFYEIQNAAAGTEQHVEVVLSYKGKKEIDVRRLSLNNIEPDWIVIKQQILKHL